MPLYFGGEKRKITFNNESSGVHTYFAFTVTYYDSDGVTVLKTEKLPFGSMPSYTPTKDGMIFEGWTTELVAVTGNASYIAKWKERPNFTTASWAEIAEISESGQAAEYFSVGDTRNITFNNNGETYDVQFRIVGFNHDMTEDGGTAGISLMSVYSLDYTTIGATTVSWLNKYIGWSGSKFRDTLNSVTINMLPSDLIQHIKSVQKISAAAGSPTMLETTVDKLWVPSVTEYGLSHSTTAANQGVPYSSPSRSPYVQNKGTIGTAYEYQDTRSSSNWASSMCVALNPNLAATYNGCTGNVKVGFCI